MKINKELVKGSTAMLVLSVIENGEKYGYQIIKELERLSDATFSMNEGTLYPVLHALEKENFLEARWEETESARKRKYYRITEKGARELAAKKREWGAFSAAVDKVLGGGVCYA